MGSQRSMEALDSTSQSNPFGGHSAQSSADVAQIGISIEPAMHLKAQAELTQTANANPSTLPTLLEFAHRTAEDLFNYVGSFSLDLAQMQQAACMQNETWVPMSP